MEHPGFFRRAGPFPLSEIAKATQAELGAGADPATSIEDVRALADASPRDLSFLDNRKYLGQLKATRAAGCLVVPALAARVPEATAPLLTPEPYRAFALALMMFYPEALGSACGAGRLRHSDRPDRRDRGRRRDGARRDRWARGAHRARARGSPPGP